MARHGAALEREGGMLGVAGRLLPPNPRRPVLTGEGRGLGLTGEGWEM